MAMGHLHSPEYKLCGGRDFMVSTSLTCSGELLLIHDQEYMKTVYRRIRKPKGRAYYLF